MEELLGDILEYRQKRKLVFFVGAGVSAVSNYPSWNELITTMADKLEYQYRKDENGRPSFSSEEFLQIPQIYYDNRGEEYFSVVKEQFKGSYTPNKIHDLIMKLNPYHILTTNYDTLLEDAANKYGINYSVINSDKKVSIAPNQRYIIKVHGDFEENKFVLKEQDYLNYENDYKLIDNIVKTIIATHLIVFVGYGLNDYNIKLILNWVKQVQGRTFIEPIFIYTGNQKLEKTKINYYKKRKIRIIDTNSIGDFKTYEERYIAALNVINQYNKVNNLKDKKNKVEYLYNLLIELKELEYIRTKDLNMMFNNVYRINEHNYIVNISKDIDYMEEVYSLIKNKNEISDEELKEKILVIEEILKKARIKGISDGTEVYAIVEENKICNDIFWGEYKQAEEYIQHLSSIGNGTSYEWYKMAYDFYALGELEKSYNLYTELLEYTKQTEEWIYYYACQINRRFVYLTICGLNNYCKLKLPMICGKKLEIFNHEYLESISNEMDNFNYEDLYYELPADIREKYKFLHRLCSSNIYSEDIINAFEDIYKINQEISNHTVYLLGQSPYKKLKVNFLDSIRFIYDNRLLYWGFAEHKKYIRTTMISYLKGIYESINNNKDSIQISMPEITTQEIILILKNFTPKDIVYLEKEVDIERFKVIDIQMIERYISGMLDYYDENFYPTIQNKKIAMYFINKEEFNCICYFAYHFVNDCELRLKIISFILDKISPIEMDDDERLYLIEKYISKDNCNDSIKECIEKNIYI